MYLGLFRRFEFLKQHGAPSRPRRKRGLRGLCYAGRQRQLAFQQIDAHADVEGEHVAHGFGAASGEEFAEDGDGFVTAGHGKVFGRARGDAVVRRIEGERFELAVVEDDHFVRADGGYFVIAARPAKPRRPGVRKTGPAFRP